MIKNECREIESKQVVVVLFTFVSVVTLSGSTCSRFFAPRLRILHPVTRGSFDKTGAMLLINTATTNPSKFKLASYRCTGIPALPYFQLLPTGFHRSRFQTSSCVLFFLDSPHPTSSYPPRMLTGYTRRNDNDCFTGLHFRATVKE